MVGNEYILLNCAKKYATWVIDIFGGGGAASCLRS